MLLDGRFRGRRLQHLYIRCNVDGLDVGELANLMLLNPAKEVAHGPVIGHARVSVAELSRKVLEEAPCGMLTGAGDYGRHGERAAQRRCLSRCRDLDDRRQVAPLGAHADTLL
jgi:hypothetical protein